METAINKHLSEFAKDWPWRAKKAGKNLKILGQEAKVSPPTLYGAINGTNDTRISILQRVEDKLQEWGV